MGLADVGLPARPGTQIWFLPRSGSYCVRRCSAMTAYSMSVTWCECTHCRVPSPNHSLLNKSNCVVEKSLLRGRICNQCKPGLSHLETPRLQATFECSKSGHVDKKEFSSCLRALENTVPNPDTVTGCTSASFRAVPLHGIVTLSNRSYHYTNLYACRQIAFWIKAKSSPKQCSTSQTRCRRSLSFGSSTRSAMPDTNLMARCSTPDHALQPLPPCISHTNIQTISAHRHVDILDMAPSRLKLVNTCHVPSSVTLNPTTSTSWANMSTEDYHRGLVYKLGRLPAVQW